MRTVLVEDPHGSTWRVRVLWQPRWHALALRFGGWRRKRKNDGGPDMPNLDVGGGGGGHHGGGGGGGFDLGDDLVVGLAIIVCLVVFGFLFWWLILPLLLLVVDALVVMVLLVAGIAGRVLFRRPWTVRATGPDKERISLDVVGWRAALRARDDLATQLQGWRS